MVASFRLPCFPGRLILIGFGGVARAVLPLLQRSFNLAAERITVISNDEEEKNAAIDRVGVFVVETLTRRNFVRVLGPLVSEGDVLINLSFGVSSVALIDFCHQRNVIYLDVETTPWTGGHTDMTLSSSLRAGYALREAVLSRKAPFQRGATALIAHGANSGMTAHYLKRALLTLADDLGVETGVPWNRSGWAGLMQRLGVRSIHLGGCDSQTTLQPRRRFEFVNSWSPVGLANMAAQPAELGWGTHERDWSVDVRRHHFGCGSAVCLERPGGSSRIRTWSPEAGATQGLLLSCHGVSATADYFTLRDSHLRYRPTCCYAFQPCDDAWLSLRDYMNEEWAPPEKRRVLGEDVQDGVSECGVLLLGHARGAYWYGARLSIAEARRWAPEANAATAQTAAGVLAGVAWSLSNPQSGIVEPEELEFQYPLDVASPYMGEVVGQYSDWTPLKGRGLLFEEALDVENPWKFQNFRV
ncbi:Homospermidine synthase [Azospirillaceae bacterium]